MGTAKGLERRVHSSSTAATCRAACTRACAAARGIRRDGGGRGGACGERRQRGAGGRGQQRRPRSWAVIARRQGLWPRRRCGGRGPWGAQWAQPQPVDARQRPGNVWRHGGGGRTQPSWKQPGEGRPTNTRCCAHCALANECSRRCVCLSTSWPDGDCRARLERAGPAARHLRFQGPCHPRRRPQGAAGGVQLATLRTIRWL
mmetsp:Transcript_69313/g.137437  ORF Transcript_69313/g.137437 Transcript_69313/m.137437 type:complete len:202 (+) Transcript_69313:633-1238(+)